MNKNLYTARHTFSKTGVADSIVKSKSNSSFIETCDVAS